MDEKYNNFEFISQPINDKYAGISLFSLNDYITHKIPSKNTRQWMRRAGCKEKNPKTLSNDGRFNN